MTFYVVRSDRFDDSSFAYGVEPSNVRLAPSAKCPICDSSLTIMKWLPPNQIAVSRRKLGDFIFGTFLNVVVSQKFKLAFESESLKGIESFSPVEIIGQIKNH